MKREVPITVRELIQMLRTKKHYGEHYNVYGTGDGENVDLSTYCYIADPQEVTDDDEEIFPAFVVENDLELWFYSEILEDVLDNAVMQKPGVSDETVLRAIEYYNSKDTFMDL